MTNERQRGFLKDFVASPFTRRTENLPLTLCDFRFFFTDFLPLFLKEETTKECPVIIIDDSLYENEEKFYVTLISHLGSRINSERNSSVVVIAPDAKDGKITHYNNRL